ncbi:hypothetical protein [Rhodococcus sp. NPDC003348]
MNLEDLRAVLAAALDRAERASAEAERLAGEAVPTRPAESVPTGEVDPGDGGAGYPRSSWLV